MDHLTSNRHSVGIIDSQSSPNFLGVNNVLPSTCMHAQMAAIHCRLGEMGVVHIAHTILSYKKFWKYGPPIFFGIWTGPY